MATTRAEAIEKVAGLIKGIDFGMLTTVTEDGSFHSRPMSTQEVEFDGDAWFFSEGASGKVADIRRNPQVNVAYHSGNNYVSLSGNAAIVTDVAKKRELWKDELKAWFENGPEDPNVVLIKVQAKSAEYWEGPKGGPIGNIVATVVTLVTGNDDAYGDNEKVRLD